MKKKKTKSKLIKRYMAATIDFQAKIAQKNVGTAIKQQFK